MQQSRFGKALVLVVFGALSAGTAQAFNFGNMMNPSKWWGGDDDRYDDEYYGAPPYGYPPPGYAPPGYATPGYAAPGYVQPGYAQPGYAPAYPAQGYGYAVPGYAAPAAPAPVAPAPVAPAPAASAPAASATASEDEAEIARLRERVRELEAAKASAPPTAGSPYDRDYRFKDSERAAPAAEAAATQSAPQFPVYSPFGPPAEFPPPVPDDEVTPADVGTVVAPPVPAVPETAEAGAVETNPPPAADAQGEAVFSPYGNPANYVPPMQDVGQRVFEFGR